VSKERIYINEYNDRVLDKILEISDTRESAVAKIEAKAKKNIKYDSLKGRYSRYTPGERRKAMDELDSRLLEEVNQGINEKWIRKYRTICDDLFIGGIIENTNVPVNYIKQKIRSPGMLDGRLVPKRVTPGMFYSFIYDPVGKVKLKYYDRTPTVLVLSTFKGGFTGLNWHLIDVEARLRLFNLLQMYKRGTRYRTFIKIVWDVIRRSDKFRLGRPIVRKYLNRQVQSKLIRIPDDDWELMLVLPTTKFIGKDQAAVHKENKKKAYTS